jgi:hypothetical protein
LIHVKRVNAEAENARYLEVRPCINVNIGDTCVALCVCVCAKEALSGSSASSEFCMIESGASRRVMYEIYASLFNSIVLAS